MFDDVSNDYCFIWFEWNKINDVSINDDINSNWFIILFLFLNMKIIKWFWENVGIGKNQNNSYTNWYLSKLLFLKATLYQIVCWNFLVIIIGIKRIQLHSTKTNYVKVIFVSIVFRIEFILVTILEYFRDKRWNEKKINKINDVNRRCHLGKYYLGWEMHLRRKLFFLW